LLHRRFEVALAVGKPHTLRVFVAKKRLFLVETGGPKAEVERYKAALDWMEATLKLD
jgi:hypothetical protein